MSVRKHDDSVKSGKGIDGDLGEDFVKPGPDQFTGYPGQRSKERSQPGAYTSNDSGLVQSEDFQFTARGGATGAQWGDDILDDVESNQRPGGEYDSTGPIRAGVNKKQGK